MSPPTSAKLKRLKHLQELLEFANLVLFYLRFVVGPILAAATSFLALALFYISLSGHSLGLEQPEHPMIFWQRILAFGLGMIVSLLPWATWRLVIFPARLQNKPPFRWNLPPSGGSSGSAGGRRIPRPPGGRPPALIGTASLSPASKS